MSLFNYFTRYKNHPEAIVISCFFNPLNSPYRLRAFDRFYDSIKHLNHSITECVIGDAKPQLPETANIHRIQTSNLLWHKEAILNRIVATLPKKYKYIFWVDADVIFTNRNWLTEGVEQLKKHKIIQPFEYCVHLNQDEDKPDFNVQLEKQFSHNVHTRHNQLWRSFCANFVTNKKSASSENYDMHGHVGFAWGARREVLASVPLYDKALIGGADHIIAHAAAGHIPHPCITKSFKDDLENVLKWSKRFHLAVQGEIGYVKGDLYHIWHGDIKKRQYLKRIQDFTVKTKEIQQKDSNGLYVSEQNDNYMSDYFKQREVPSNSDDGFLTSMALGYATDSTILGSVLGGNPIGAMIGDMLRQDESPSNDNAPETNSVPELPSVPIQLENDDSPMAQTETSSENFS